MTEFHLHKREQQEKLSDKSITDISSFHESKHNVPTTKQNSIEHNNENGTRNDTSSLMEVVPQHKSKSSDQQQTTGNQISQTLVDQLSLTESSNMNSISNLSNQTLSSSTDKNSNKNELPTIIDESGNPIIKIKKRTTPISKSSSRQRAYLTDNPISNESLNIQIPTNSGKTKSDGTKVQIKKGEKTIPIFIAPKKSSTPSHAFSFGTIDESVQNRQKSNIKQQNISSDTTTSTLPMTNWTPNSSTSPIRSHMQSSGISYDENSSDDSDDESLFIRKPKPKRIDQQSYSPIPLNISIPSAIFITDPNGCSHKFDSYIDEQEKHDYLEQDFDDSKNTNDINSLNPNNISSSSETIMIASLQSSTVEKHSLHSIGEEEEEEEEEDYQNHTDRNIFSKELIRMEILNRSRQTTSNNNTNQDDDKAMNLEPDKELLGRRWSDGNADDEKLKTPSPSSIVKATSAASIAKQTVNTPVKLSITKYLLMKLHITPSTKDNESNIPPPTVNPPKKRLVRRSADKKHSRTNVSTLNKSNSNLKSNNSIHESSSTLVEKEAIQKQISTTDSIQSINNAYRFSTNNNNKLAKGETLGSVGNLNTIDSDDDEDDDIDGNFEKAKKGSQTSINSLSSEKRARYGLDISGTIELKLTYTLATGAFDITILKCTNLAKAKRNQTSDPYVKIYLLPDRSKNGKRRSSTKKDTIDPVYDEKFRYHVTKQEFETRVLWISVWSEAAIGQNDFLGEIHLPLTGCTLDKPEEHILVAQKKKNEIKPMLTPTLDPGEIQFQLVYMENPRHKEVGTIQVHYIQCKSIYHGRNPVEAICKGLLMPDKVKRKIPGIRQGPMPKWDVPLRWDGVRQDNLENTSIEISIWYQERLRKFIFGFVRLNLAKGHYANKPAAWSDSTKYEKAAWERFIAKPTVPHTITLPLRPASGRTK